MIRRPPRTRCAGIGFDVRGTAAEVLGHDHVGHDVLREGAAAHAAGRPMVRIPNRDHPLAIGANLDVGKARGAATGDFQFLIAVEHQLDRPAQLLGKPGGQYAPAIGGKLAAEPAADVVAMYGHVVGRDSQRSAQLAGCARDVLRGKVRGQLAILPVGRGAVGLQAHVRNGANAVAAFDHGGGFLEQPVDLLLLEGGFVFAVARLLFQLHLAGALGGAAGGLGGGQVFLVDEHVERFVVGLDGGQPLGHGAFVFTDDTGDQVALPFNLIARVLQRSHGDHAGDFFGGARVDRLNFAMGQWTAEPAGQQPPWAD